jgi:prophage regulatory protein
MKLLDHDGLKAKGINYSKPQLWRKVKDKSFPAPIKIGAARNAWVESEIDEWVERLIADRDGVESKRGTVLQPSRKIREAVQEHMQGEQQAEQSRKVGGRRYAP